MWNCEAQSALCNKDSCRLISARVFNLYSIQSSLFLSVSCNALCLQSLELIQALFVRQFQLAPRCHRLNLYRIYLFVIIIENCFHPISFLYNYIAKIGIFSVLLQVISLLLLYHNHTVTILQLYSNKAKSSFEDRLKFVCCSLNKRTTNEQQTDNRRRKGIVIVWVEYR